MTDKVWEYKKCLDIKCGYCHPEAGCVIEDAIEAKEAVVCPLKNKEVEK